MTRLRHLCDIRSGHAFRSGLPESVDGAYRIIQPKDLSTFHRAYFKEQDAIRVDVQAPKPLKDGDILVLSRGKFLAVVFDFLDFDRWIVPSSIQVLSLTTKAVLPHYVANYLNSPAGQRQFLFHGKRTTVPFISTKGLGEIEIPTPSLQRQESLIDLDLASAEYSRLTARRTELIQSLKGHALQSPALQS